MIICIQTTCKNEGKQPKRWIDLSLFLKKKKFQASEVPKTLRNAVNIKAELSRSAVNQLSDKKNWHRNQVQPKGVPFEMTVVTADRVPDRQNIHVLETISTISSPIEDFDQQKQIITIENYEDENYTYDQETENGMTATFISFFCPQISLARYFNLNYISQSNNNLLLKLLILENCRLFFDLEIYKNKKFNLKQHYILKLQV